MSKGEFVSRGDVRQALSQIDELSPANAAVLAYQFGKAAEQHPDGFTMDLFGNLYDSTKGGYAVSILPKSFDSFGDALDTYSRLIKIVPFRPLYFGYWKDAETGTDYIDIVVVNPVRAFAEALGRKQGQIAIFDFNTMQEVRLD